MEHQQPGDRPKSNWQDLITVTQQGTELAVRVQLSDGPRPQYSYQLGRMREGKFLPFMRAFLHSEQGRFSLVPLDLEVMKTIVAEAERFICEDAEKRELERRGPPASEQRRSAGGDERRTSRPGRRPRDDDRRRDHDPWR